MASREGAWRAELIETLPGGTQRWRIVKTEPPEKSRRVQDYESRLRELHDRGLSDGEIGMTLGFHRQTIGDFRRSLGISTNFKFGGKPGLDDMEKQRIREFHSKGLPINRIAEEIGRSNITVTKFCREEKLDTSRARGKGYRKQRHRENLISYLEEHGPTPQSTLSTDLEIPNGRFSRIAREMFDQVERFKFKVGSSRGRGGIKYGGYSIYGDINIQEMGNVFALRDDPRIVDFVAESTSFKVETPQDARTLVLHLKKQLGSERARKVVEKLGYVYSKDRQARPRRRESKKGEIWTQLKKGLIPVKWIPDKIVFTVYKNSAVISVWGTSLLERFESFSYVDVYYREDAEVISIKPQKDKTKFSYKILSRSSHFFQFSAHRIRRILRIKETTELAYHWEDDMLILHVREGGGETTNAQDDEQMYGKGGGFTPE